MNNEKKQIIDINPASVSGLGNWYILERFLFCIDLPKQYVVSNHGRIIRLSHTVARSNGIKQFFKARELKKCISDTGYEVVYIRINGKNTAFKVHQLVAKTFVILNNHLPIINHKDGNKRNNHFKNLEWCTYSHNLKHAYQNNLRIANVAAANAARKGGVR